MRKTTKSIKAGKAAIEAPKRERRTAVEVRFASDETRYRDVAKVLIPPEVNAAAVIEKWQLDTHDVNDLADELAAQVAAVHTGDLSRAEAILIAQAHTRCRKSATSSVSA